jgi:hypothetical protein
LTCLETVWPPLTEAVSVTATTLPAHLLTNTPCPGGEAQGQGHRSTRLGVVMSVAKLDIAVLEPDIAPAGSAFAADGGCGRGTTDRHHGRRQAYGGDVGMARAMTVVI